jgi:hypothetical protein
MTITTITVNIIICQVIGDVNINCHQDSMSTSGLTESAHKGPFYSHQYKGEITVSGLHTHAHVYSQGYMRINVHNVHTHDDRKFIATNRHNFVNKLVRENAKEGTWIISYIGKRNTSQTPSSKCTKSSAREQQRAKVSRRLPTAEAHWSRFSISISVSPANHPPWMMVDECGVVGGMIGRADRNTLRKPTPVLLCPQIPHDLTKQWPTYQVDPVSLHPKK